MNWTRRLGAVVLGGALAVTALAGDMVTVDLKEIREDIAKDLKVDVNQVPEAVQAPAGIAAKVCNLSPEMLSTQSNPSCKARTVDDALNQALLQQIKAQKK